MDERTARLTATVCIATRNRPDSLRATLETWRAGTVLPAEVRVADASDDEQSRLVCEESWAPLLVHYLRSEVASAALQRNLAAEGCHTDLVVFCDDDVALPPHALETLAGVFQSDGEGRIGGVAGTIEGMHHGVPGRWLRRYYRFQAGYDHEHYGGHFFGPAINVLPTDRPHDPVLYPSSWLNTTLVAYRTRLFETHRFPAFPGYSFQEDVHVSARIRRTHELYFHRGVRYIHNATGADYKLDARMLAEMAMRNRWRNAGELLQLTGTRRVRAFLLSVLFESACLLRGRPSGWREWLLASWTAYLKLVAAGSNDGAKLS